MSHAARSERVKLRIHNTDLAVDAIKGVAWRGRCACGWQSPRWYMSRDEALAVAREHRRDELGLD